MKVYGDYSANGFALVKNLLHVKVLNAVLFDIRADLAPEGASIASEEFFAPVLSRAAFEKYGPDYKPLKFLLWGLTPLMEKLAKVTLEPTYDFFRLYRAGDVCKVHADRPSCEHSMSLTLGYSEDITWPFHVSLNAVTEPGPISNDFQGEPFATLEMRPGDAVIYRGDEARHGRIEPNPNAWSAHIFLHWVERGGKYADSAFECGSSTQPVDFKFA